MRTSESAVWWYSLSPDLKPRLVSELCCANQGRQLQIGSSDSPDIPVLQQGQPMQKLFVTMALILPRPYSKSFLKLYLPFSCVLGCYTSWALLLGKMFQP